MPDMPHDFVDCRLYSRIFIKDYIIQEIRKKILEKESKTTYFDQIGI